VEHEKRRGRRDDHQPVGDGDDPRSFGRVLRLDCPERAIGDESSTAAIRTIFERGVA
jgi:hypothetical protein